MHLLGDPAISAPCRRRHTTGCSLPGDDRQHSEQMPSGTWSAYRPPFIGCRTPSGLSRSACVRYGRGGCPLYPGGGGALPASNDRLAGTRRLPAAGPCSPACRIPPARVIMTRRHRGFTHVHPSGLPQPVTPGWNGVLGHFPGLRTPRLPAAHAGAGTVLRDPGDPGCLHPAAGPLLLRSPSRDGLPGRRGPRPAS